MVISDKYRYVFVELPHTGSTAITKELCEHYGGVKVLTKHARYHQFWRIATPGQRRYFVFSGVRNPLDETVSLFFRYKTDHHGRYSTPEKSRQNGGSVSAYSVQAFRFIREMHADFPAFLQWFYRKPYDNWSNLEHRRFNYIIRFERLQEDFATVLQRLGIPQARPLPVVNKTGEKREAFWSYYTPEVQDYARRIFGPFMKEWGYEFPPEWGGRPFLARVRCSFDCSACCAGPIGDCAASDCLGERLEERKVR